MQQYVLKYISPDQAGITHALTGVISRAQGNILESAQFSDFESGKFCVRIKFESPAPRERLRTAFADQLEPFDPIIQLREANQHRRALVMVSQLDHCLDDLLYRYRRGELSVEIPVVVSNHELLRPMVEREGIPFAHIPVTPATKAEAEARVIQLIEESDVDFVILARYMQILSDDFSQRFASRIINIHHSFLPSFKGAKPYHQARERGVKLVGATAHYVTADLDEGPIITQGVSPVSHRMSAEQMVVVGRDIERAVLSKTVQLHAEERVFLTNGHTIILD